MTDKPTSRDLSSRVQIDFHKRGNRFQKLMWWASGVCALVALAAVLINSSFGQPKIYEAGPLITAHRMFENDCAACHTTWAPLNRLIRFGSKADVSSIDEAKCQACHAGSAHFGPYEHNDGVFTRKNGHDADLARLPPHDHVGCAECHRDHQGDVDLTSVANAMCVNCHADLEAAGHTSDHFANEIRSFEEHPPFKFSELVPGQSAAPKSAHGAFGRLDKFEQATPGFRSTGWQDKTALAFNHARHLGPKGILDAEGNPTRLDCASCHEPDADRVFFQPINFEKHCRDCHPLNATNFDVELRANQDATKHQVPHEKAHLVRSHLAQFYKTLEIQRGEPLTPEKKKQIQTRVLQYEDSVFREIDRTRTLNLQELTACGLCHETRVDASGNREIIPPQIPDRWLPHSRFNHDPHRIVDCQQCHQGVGPDAAGKGGSVLTGEVLMPKLQVCQKCHSETVGEKPAGFVSAQSNCVECHTYHKRKHESAQQNRTIEQLLSGDK